MNGLELFALAPLGARVAFTDGTPRPPERFNKKLATWKGNNAEGFFVGVTPNDGKPWSSDSFVLQTRSGPFLIVNQHFDAKTTKTFEVTPPAPGTILAYGDFGGRIEIKHVWANIEQARDWAGRPPKGFVYKFNSCGHKYFIVAEDGTLRHGTPTEDDIT